MEIKPLGLLIALLAGVSSGLLALRAPPPSTVKGEPPVNAPRSASPPHEKVRSITLRIDQYSGGSCATVSVERFPRPLIDSCHGWAISDCDGMVVLQSRGVRLDDGAILRPAETGGPAKPIFLRDILQKELDRTRSPASEYVHLNLSELQCSATGADLPFEGSVMKVGATGSADRVSGTVKISGDGRFSVNFDNVSRLLSE
jgi:hypothetical protein